MGKPWLQNGRALRQVMQGQPSAAREALWMLPGLEVCGDLLVGQCLGTSVHWDAEQGNPARTAQITLTWSCRGASTNPEQERI